MHQSSPLQFRSAPQPSRAAAQNHRRAPTGALARALILAIAVAAVCPMHGCVSKNRSKEADPAFSADEARRLSAEGDRAHAAGNLQRAGELYRDAIQSKPDFGSAWNNLGVVLRELNNNKDAADAFRRAADLLPADPRPLENLGLVYLENGFDADALRYYREALDRDPNWLPALRGMTVAVKRLNSTEEYYASNLKRALFMETDPKWREMMQRQRMRIEEDLRQKAKSESGR